MIYTDFIMINSPEKKFYQKSQKKHAIQRGNQGELLNFDSNIKEIYERWFSYGMRYHITDEVLDKAKKYNILVEIGAGGCYTLKYFSEIYHCKKIIGYDIIFSDKILEQNSYKNIQLLEGNFNYDFPLENNSVDCLVMMMVIEHLFDPFHSFSEVHRLLTDDGVAFINLPLVTSIKNRLRLLFGRVPITSVPFKQWWINKEWDGNHLHYFSINSIKKICAKYNLEIIKITPVGSFIFFKKFLPSLLSDELSFCVRKIKK